MESCNIYTAELISVGSIWRMEWEVDLTWYTWAFFSMFARRANLA